MQLTSEQFIYPRLKNTLQSQANMVLPSAEQIYKEIELCQKLAISTALKMDLIPENKPKQNYVCKVGPLAPKTAAEQKPERVQSKAHNQSTNTLNDSIELMASDLKNIQLKNYASKVNPDDISETGPYVEVECNGNRRVIVKKTSLCWLLGTEHSKLSNDRWRRVMHKTQPKLRKKIHKNPHLQCKKRKKRINKKRKR